MRMAARTRYVNTNLPGRTFSIDRLTRVESGKKKYKAVAVIKLYDSQLQRAQNVMFFIELDAALQNREVSLL